MPLPLVYYDNPLLRKKAKKIEAINKEIIKLSSDMIETMIHHNGVGLAAPQVGVLLRIFVIRDEIVAADGSFQLGEPEVLINPALSNPSKETVLMSEGCLSIPGVHAELERPSKINIRYQTLDGHIRDEIASNFRARVMMHENDHINGVLFIDRLPSSSRNKIASHLREVKQRYSQS